MQIQAQESTSKLSAYSDRFQVHCFEIPCSTGNDIHVMWTLLCHHIFHHKSINSRQFSEFEADPSLEKYLKTFCLLRSFPSPLLRNSMFHRQRHPCHPDSASWPHIWLQVNQFSSVRRIRSRSKVAKVPQNFLPTQIFLKSIASKFHSLQSKQGVRSSVKK